MLATVRRQTGRQPKLICNAVISVHDLFSYDPQVPFHITRTVGTKTTCLLSGLFGDSSYASKIPNNSQQNVLKDKVHNSLQTTSNWHLDHTHTQKKLPIAINQGIQIIRLQSWNRLPVEGN
jgi:hypothetical protein